MNLKQKIASVIKQSAEEPLLLINWRNRATRCWISKDDYTRISTGRKLVIEGCHVMRDGRGFIEGRRRTYGLQPGEIVVEVAERRYNGCERRKYDLDGNPIENSAHHSGTCRFQCNCV